MILHPFPPLYDRQSRVLILGSFPSVKSREGCFFYHHPQNRFWKVMAAVLGVAVPTTLEEKAAMLHTNHIALWDVIGGCEIVGSSDSSIRNATPNDLSPILAEANIRAIFCNGGTAYTHYQTFNKSKYNMEAIKLPSTSPANAAWSLDRLIGQWTQITDYLR